MAPKADKTKKVKEDKFASDLTTKEQKLVGGGIINFLLGFNQHVIHKLNFKLTFWCITGAVAVFVSLGWAFFIMAMGFIAIAASYVKTGRPDGIPLAPYKGLDVLLGRPIKVSTDEPELVSNNNVSVTTYQGRYILAYRQSDYHFPSARSQVVVASSHDLETWKTEWVYKNGCDLRETLLFELKGKLILYFFSLKPTHDAFTPIHVFYTTSTDVVTWTEPQKVCQPTEVPWEIKVRGEGSDAVAYKASYLGDHYGDGDMLVLFEKSADGTRWAPAGNGSSSVVHRGGVCEVAFEFTTCGDLVAIGRNEDGDATGFGSQLFYAKADDLGSWTALKISIPFRFDSPRLLRSSAGEFLLFARFAAEPYQYAPSWMSFTAQKTINLILCSLFPKSTAVYRIAPQEEWGDDGAGAVQLIRFFEHTVGDTGFFSVTPELGSKALEDRWVVANYTSTTVHSHAPWFIGQMRPSNIYVVRARVLGGVAH